MQAWVKDLIEYSEKLFTQRGSVVATWQESAENFMPELADFMATRYTGADYAANLVTSHPLLVARDLTNIIDSMLRPPNKWFFIETDQGDKIDMEGRRWCEWATGVQYRVMNDKQAGFKKATSLADKFYVLTGQAAIAPDINWQNTTYLYRTPHLRDIVWCEDDAGNIDRVDRKWFPTARDLEKRFGDKIHKNVREKLVKDPYGTVNCKKIHLTADQYQGDKKLKPGFQYVTLIVDTDNQHLMEVSERVTLGVVIPRWATLPGTQYSMSPAVWAALPEARLMQSITLTLLQAGEKAVDPPVTIPEGVLRGDIQTYAGGINIYDSEYDEGTGQVMRPINIDKTGLQFGLEMQNRSAVTLMNAFFLDKLNLSPIDPSMTAYQTSQIIQDNMRKVLTLMGPTEDEYNGQLCDVTFRDLRQVGAFGPEEDWPDSVRGSKIKFKFESPLHKSIEREKGQNFIEAQGLIAQAAATDQAAPAMINARKALREALLGIGTPADWIRSDDEMEEIEQQQRQQQQMAQAIASIGQGAAAAEQVGKAGQALQGMSLGGGV